MRRLAHRRAEDLAVPERPAGNPAADLCMRGVLLRIGLLSVEYEDSDHGQPLSCSKRRGD